ncbi:MAG TPA: transcriptional coactivator p15/PC4 family protein [Acidobacteriota bacterium]|nr:transcriptional coactivator p15/PC4 family protein [Acidobacteriota bacterium]
MIIKEIEKSDTEKIRVELSEFKGKQYLNFRILFKDEKDDSWKYTKKGITLSVDLVDDLKKGIDKAASQIYESLPGA